MPILAIPYPEIDPEIFSIDIGGFQFALRWYALAYIAGLLIGWRICVRLMRAPGLWPGNRAPMTPAQPEELLTWMVLGVIIGGRLGFVLFYNPVYFMAHPAEILMLWQGGMSFHGGFIGVIAGVILFCRVKELPILQVADAVALAAPVGLFFGRLANFINGELWGRTTSVSWGMVFPNAGPLPRHPSQLYEATLEGILLFCVLMALALGRHWLKRPGAITGMFFIGYGLARTFVENFREGNAEFMSPGNPAGHIIRFGAGPEAGGLTMGQVLSIPMILIGALFMIYAFSRPEPAAPRRAGKPRA